MTLGFWWELLICVSGEGKSKACLFEGQTTKWKHVCVCVCVHIHVCVYMCVWLSVLINVHECVLVYMCVCTCVHTNVCVCKLVCVLGGVVALGLIYSSWVLCRGGSTTQAVCFAGWPCSRPQGCCEPSSPWLRCRGVCYLLPYWLFRAGESVTLPWWGQTFREGRMSRSWGGGVAGSKTNGSFILALANCMASSCLSFLIWKWDISPYN